MPSREIIERVREKRKRQEEAMGLHQRKAKEKAQRAASAARAAKGRKRHEEILDRLPTNEALRGAEIGVWRGATAKVLLEKRPLLTYIMVDMWKKPEAGTRYASAYGSIQRMTQDIFDAAYRRVCELPEKHGERAVIMRMSSVEAAGRIESHSLDFVFIDAEHTYEAVREDIAAWLPKVAYGGWIGGHDYGNLPNFPGVKKAVDEAFPSGVELGDDHTWFVKVPERRMV